jgi:hypothetical protein
MVREALAKLGSAEASFLEFFVHPRDRPWIGRACSHREERKMFAIVHRYTVDESRMSEIAMRVDQSLMPRLTQLTGFGSYWLIATAGGMTSVSVFETSEQAEKSTRIAAKWLKDERFDAAVTNAQITAGRVLAGTATAPVLG